MYARVLLMVFCSGVLLTGCQENRPRLVSEPYPNLKWGFTTQNFISTTPVSVEAVKGFVTYAKEQGFSWIELRDPDASLTLGECKEIASFARQNKIEINYSVQRGLLDDDFWSVFEKAVENTAVFVDGPRYFRALASIGEGQYGWTKNEFSKLIKTANRATAAAAEKNIGFTVENSGTALDGREKPYYGLWEFFEQTDPQVHLQLDTANLFTGPVPITPEQAELFIREFAPRTSYLHLKSAHDGLALKILDGNPLSFDKILKIIHNNGVYYIAIEINSDTSEERIYRNMETSIKHLMKEGILLNK